MSETTGKYLYGHYLNMSNEVPNIDPTNSLSQDSYQAIKTIVLITIAIILLFIIGMLVYELFIKKDDDSDKKRNSG